MTTCHNCTHFAHGGCVHPVSDREFDSDDITACDLFAAPVQSPQPVKYETPRAWYVQQALDATSPTRPL